MSMHPAIAPLLMLLVAASAAVAYPVCTGSAACDPAQNTLTGSDGTMFCCPGPSNPFENVGSTAAQSSCQYPTDCTLPATYASCALTESACPSWALFNLGTTGTYCCAGGKLVARTTTYGAPSYYQCSLPTVGHCSDGTWFSGSRVGRRGRGRCSAHFSDDFAIGLMNSNAFLVCAFLCTV